MNYHIAIMILVIQVRRKKIVNNVTANLKFGIDLCHKNLIVQVLLIVIHLRITERHRTHIIYAPDIIPRIVSMT
jgi:hypothetical protein